MEKKILYSIWNTINRILRFIVFRIFRMNISEENWDKFLQFVKFGMVGLSNTVISYVIYVCSLLFFERKNIFENGDYLVAQGISFFLSVLWSFYWNRKYVFQADKDTVPWPQALIKTYISYAFTGIFLNSILSYMWVNWINVPKLIAPLINLIVSVPINFFMNKFWAFREKNK